MTQPAARRAGRREERKGKIMGHGFTQINIDVKNKDKKLNAEIAEKGKQKQG